MKKNDFDKLVEKYKPAMKKTGEQLTKAIKTAEKDVSKIYKVAQTHVALQMKNLQKEKLYHELGKYIAGKLSNEEFNIPGLEKYKKRLAKINTEGKKIEKKLKGSGTAKKAKTSKKK